MPSSGRKGRPHCPGGWGSRRRAQGGHTRGLSCQANQQMDSGALRDFCTTREATYGVDNGRDV
jgi:hypothetical protein